MLQLWNIIADFLYNDVKERFAKKTVDSTIGAGMKIHSKISFAPVYRFSCQEQAVKIYITWKCSFHISFLRYSIVCALRFWLASWNFGFHSDILDFTVALVGHQVDIDNAAGFLLENEILTEKAMNSNILGQSIADRISLWPNDKFKVSHHSL